VRIARKAIETSTKFGKHRWVIERSIAWLFGYRRLSIRYERHANLFCTFLTLAAMFTCYKNLPGFRLLLSDLVQAQDRRRISEKAQSLWRLLPAFPQ
jgi:hypothetical protein